jgi:hypothetical protein
VPGCAEHVWSFLEFSKSIPAQSVLKWSEMAEQWEKNNKEVNLLVVTTESELLIEKMPSII